MARLKFGSIITSGSGSIGGHTIQNSRGGVQLRTKPINKKQPTAAQSLIRSYNPQLQQGWRDLSEDNRIQWNAYAAGHGVYNKNGDKYPLSGHSLWMRFNYEYISNGFVFQPNVFKATIGPLGKELILNGNFENGFTSGVAQSWSRNGTFTPLAMLGFNGIGFSQGASFISQSGRVWQSLDFISTKTYRIKGYLKSDTSSTVAGIIIRSATTSFVSTIRNAEIQLNTWVPFLNDYSPVVDNIGGFIGLDARTTLTLSLAMDKISVREFNPEGF